MKRNYFGIFNSWDAIDDEIRNETRKMLAECNDCHMSDISDERVTECILSGLDDERMNLDIETEGHIIAFANLGFWNGHCNGYIDVGTNVRDILSSYYGCEDCEWYADKYNVRLKAYHHDGTHYIVFRYVDSRERAENIADMILDGRIETEDDFFKRTKSIRPFIAKVYGWKQYGKQVKSLKQ